MMSTMRKALYDALVTYSAPLPVFNREDLIIDPATTLNENKKYAVIWEEGTKPSAGNQGDYGFRVAIHYPPGYTDEMDDYLDGLGELLRNPISSAGKYYEFEVGDISEYTTNDDDTISRDRLLMVPAWG